MENTDFINLYIQNLANEVSELSKMKVLLVSKEEFKPSDNISNKHSLTIPFKSSLLNFAISNYHLKMSLNILSILSDLLKTLFNSFGDIVFPSRNINAPGVLGSETISKQINWKSS